ncbi:MAG: DMT family transporter [Anaerolineae bacterium]|nr:DMT family transporter [Anaerolineae bacterium]MBT7192258.1 DMT family transporter [Anaerolineae bacterium]MBT7990915.1 DMT family transporter [Anaerolineae bacterium]
MKNWQKRGVVAALSSAAFLGLAPVFGKQAILLGFSPFAVVALRTGMAAMLLLLLLVVFKREYLYVFPLGLAGCALAGIINGVGSLFYYLALGRLTASIGQLLYSLYPIFVVAWSFLDRQTPSKLTILRIVLATTAVLLITNVNSGGVDMIGVMYMFIASALYALHLPINQRVLYEVPAPTVTLYTLLAMSAVVIPAYLFFNPQWPAENISWQPVIGLTLVTFLSRLTLFLGVKHIGGLQTALLGLGELLVTVSLGHLWLGDQLSSLQWVGVLGLGASLLLVRFEKKTPSKGSGGWLSWISPPHRLPPDTPWGPHS